MPTSSKRPKPVVSQLLTESSPHLAHQAGDSSSDGESIRTSLPHDQIMTPLSSHGEHGNFNANSIPTSLPPKTTTPLYSSSRTDLFQYIQSISTGQQVQNEGVPRENEFRDALRRSQNTADGKVITRANQAAKLQRDASRPLDVAVRTPPASSKEPIDPNKTPYPPSAEVSRREKRQISRSPEPQAKRQKTASLSSSKEKEPVRHPAESGKASKSEYEKAVLVVKRGSSKSKEDSDAPHPSQIFSGAEFLDTALHFSFSPPSAMKGHGVSPEAISMAVMFNEVVCTTPESLGHRFKGMVCRWRSYSSSSHVEKEDTRSLPKPDLYLVSGSIPQDWQTSWRSGTVEDKVRMSSTQPGLPEDRLITPVWLTGPNRGRPRTVNGYELRHILCPKAVDVPAHGLVVDLYQGFLVFPLGEFLKHAYYTEGLAILQVNENQGRLDLYEVPNITGNDDVSLVAKLMELAEPHGTTVQAMFLGGTTRITQTLTDAPLMMRKPLAPGLKPGLSSLPPSSPESQSVREDERNTGTIASSTAVADSLPSDAFHYQARKSAETKENTTNVRFAKTAITDDGDTLRLKSAHDPEEREAKPLADTELVKKSARSARGKQNKPNGSLVIPTFTPATITSGFPSSAVSYQQERQAGGTQTDKPFKPFTFSGFSPRNTKPDPLSNAASHQQRRKQKELS